jgi:hypothetical protein
MAGKIINLTPKLSKKFWLLTLNRVLRLAILKSISRRKKRFKNNNSSKPQQKSKHRLRQVADYKLGTTSRKEHKYSSFSRSSKRLEKVRPTHQHRPLATVCVDVFHRNFSSAG